MGWEDLLEKGMATHSNILAWRSPWTEKPGELQSMRSRTVGHDWVAEHALLHACLLQACYTPLHCTPVCHTPVCCTGNIPWRRKWHPTPVFLPEKSMDREACRATVHEVTKRHNWVTEHALLHSRLLQACQLHTCYTLVCCTLICCKPVSRTPVTH